MHELDTADLDSPDLDTGDEDRPDGGRHRTAPSPRRRAVARLALGASAVLVAAGVGVLSADVAGLTGPTPTGAEELPMPQLSSQLPADPTFGQTVDISAAPSSPGEESSAAVIEPGPAAAVADPSPVAPAAPPAAQPPPAPRPPQPASVPTVRPGDSCPTPGANGVTASGKPTVCTSRPRDGRTRWRVA